MGVNENDIKKLKAIPENAYLNKSVDEKYNDFKDKDPFPQIPSALLNSDDILRYIMTTGLVDPFDPKYLGDATYTCTFSGEYLRYDSKDKLETKTLSNNEELIIKPNSITYLRINEMFRVPHYMVLRFNLKVKHVYKGLLLGTGPIVDPQFVGYINIPLHNLTTNEYVIKKGAKLIDVEFTKLSIKNEWKFDLSNKKLLNFSPLYSSICMKEENKEKERTIIEYIKSSLQDNDLFFKKDKDKLSVGSSIASYVMQLEEMRDDVNTSLKDVEETKKKTDVSLIIGMITVFIAIVALVIPTWVALSDINKERMEYHNDLNYYQERISNLESCLTELIIANKKEHLDLLKKEYDLISNKKESVAIDIYNQIIDLEKEILELQKQLH